MSPNMAAGDYPDTTPLRKRYSMENRRPKGAYVRKRPNKNAYPNYVAGQTINYPPAPRKVSPEVEAIIYQFYQGGAPLTPFERKMVKMAWESGKARALRMMPERLFRGEDSSDREDL